MDATNTADEYGLLPIGPHDHPDPHSMVWSDTELRAIRRYAEMCVGAERERWKTLQRTPHRMTGACPDDIAGDDSRDPECPACRLMDELGA